MKWHDRTRAELGECHKSLDEALAKLRMQQSLAESAQGRTVELEEQAKDAQQRERSEKARHTEEMDVLLAKVQDLNTALQSSAGARDRAQEQCKQLQQELDKYVYVPTKIPMFQNKRNQMCSLLRHFTCGCVDDSDHTRRHCLVTHRVYLIACHLDSIGWNRS
jgi:hypothetical protein